MKSTKRPSPGEPVGELARVPIRECGEPFVDFTVYCPKLVVANPVYDYTRATFIRKTMADMLNQAIDSLPRGFQLGIIEGWRPRYIQRRMHLTNWLRFKELHPNWSDVQLRRVVNRFTHPHDAKAPPPHASGGAVDLMLVDEDGNRLDFSSPYKTFDPKSYPADTKGLSETALLHRRILRAALIGTGLTNYPSEYWHWSYGDQGWAYRVPQFPKDAAVDKRLGVRPDGYAIYGPVDAPEGWSPVSEDDADEALVRLWGAGPGSGYPLTKDNASTNN